MTLTSRRGEIDVPVVITDRVAGNELFIPIHHGKEGVNALTGEHHDPQVNTPAYKELAVRMTLLDRPPLPDPLPKHNFRHGSRTPIDKVPVEPEVAARRLPSAPASEPHPEKF